MILHRTTIIIHSALVQSRDSYSTLFIPIILGKLPVETKQSLARDHPTFKWTINELREAILKEFTVFENVVHITPRILIDLLPMYMTAIFYPSAQLPHHKINMWGKHCMCIYCKGSYSVMLSLTTTNI